MPIKQQLTEDMKTAMKARDMQKLGAIRFLLSEIKNIEIDKGELSDEELQNVISKQVKQMKDTIAEYEKAGRTDMIADEEAKIAVYEAYLPEAMSDEELENIVDAVIAETDNPNMGSVIGAVRAKTAGRADGGAIAALVKQKLG